MNFGTKSNDKQANGFVCSFLFCAALFLIACSTGKKERNIERSFYYWKSVFRLNGFESGKMERLNVKTLYVKFFDVDLDPQTHEPVPVAILRPASYQLPQGIRIIPVVFITNALIENLDTTRIGSMAEKMNGLINSLNRQIFNKPFEEVQLDCDWTPATRDRYFAFINAFRKTVGVQLSATIRLHQVKYISSAGIPPVDRGLLMCYNMGNLKEPETRNSIIETSELKKYTGRLQDYPIPLDIALPLFSWKVLFRQNKYNGLLRELPDSALTGSFVQHEENRYRLLKDTVLMGYTLLKDDVIRAEESDYETIMAVAGELNTRLKNTHPRLILYHMDSLLLNKYSDHELEAIYNSLR